MITDKDLKQRIEKLKKRQIKRITLLCDGVVNIYTIEEDHPGHAVIYLERKNGVDLHARKRIASNIPYNELPKHLKTLVNLSECKFSAF